MSASRLSPGYELYRSATNSVKNHLLLLILNQAAPATGSLGFQSLASFKVGGEQRSLSGLSGYLYTLLLLLVPPSILVLETSALAFPP